MALLPATLLVMGLGVYVVRSERKWLMIFVIVSTFLALLFQVIYTHLIPFDRCATLQWLLIYSVKSSSFTGTAFEL